MNEAAGDTRDEQLVVNEELDNRVQLLLAVCEHAVELLRLANRPGEPVENEAGGGNASKASRARDASNHAPVLARLVVLELVLDHVDDDVVREQPAGVHDLLRLDAELRLRGDLLTQHVAGGEVTHAKLVADAGSLRALA